MWWSCLVLSSSWAATPDTVAIDRAHEALAARDADRAVGELRAGLARTTDDAARARLRCLLGAALLSAERPVEAEAELAKVPPGATCGPRAAFLRADAIARQGRAAEAAELYAAVGGPLLGDDAHAASAEAVVALADKLLADPDRGEHTAIGLLQAALTFDLAPERAATVARRLAALVDGEDEAACAGLLAGLAARPDAVDRRLAGKVCGADDARTVLATLPADDPDRWWYLAGHADLDAGNELRLRALGLSPDGDRRRELAASLAAGGDLRAIGLLEADGSADALATQAALARTSGDHERAVELLASHLRGFPNDPHRAEVAAQHADELLTLGRIRWAGGDRDGALAAFDALAAEHPADPASAVAAIEAGYVLRALGRAEDAQHRWEEVVARHPEQAEAGLAALARQQAFDRGDLAGGTDLLRRARASWGGGADELASWKAVDLWVESAGRVVRGPTVRVGVRNVRTVEVAVHSIDLEALVRSGRGPSELQDLDVAAIAPESTYEVEVPGFAPSRDLTFDVPVRTSGSGLYAVTVRGEDQQARVMVLVSDLVAVARRVGPDVAVATFDGDGEPVGGARVLLWAGEPHEGRTDASGLWVGRDLPGSDAIVLAERRGSWAIAPLPADWGAGAEVATVRAEVDRPLVLPGDDIGVRVVGRDAEGGPLVGEWAVWLRGPVETTPARVRADALGVAVVDLLVPSIGDASPVQWSVIGVPPGQAEPVHLAAFSSAARDADGRSLSARFDGEDLVVTVIAGEGEPAPGVGVLWGEGSARTDAAGQVRIDGPPRGLPWRVDYRIPDGAGGVAVRDEGPVAEPVLHVAQEHLRAGEVARIGVEVRQGDARAVGGRVALSLFALHPAASEARPVPDPWRTAPDEDALGVDGPVSWSGAAPEAEVGARALVWSGTIEVAAGEVPLAPLPPLAAGRYALTAAIDGGTVSVAHGLEVSADGLRWVGITDRGRFVDELHLGDRLAVGVEGGRALLVAGADRILWAGIGSATVEIGPEWAGAVTWAASAPDGQVALRRTAVDPHLAVAVTADPTGRIGVRVTTAHGEPVAGAAIALTAVDERLIASVGSAQALGEARVGGASDGAGARAADLRDAARGEPISAALLAEAEWEEESERAEHGADGLLSDNRLADALTGDVPLAEIGGFGTRGMGYGGGSGSGYGSGGLGIGRSTSVWSTPSTAGVRQRVLWAQRVTDRTGFAFAALDGPAARYHLRVTAVSRRGEGTGEGTVDTAAAPRMLLTDAAPGRPEDRAVPRASIVNPTDRELAGVLTIGTTELVLQVPAHAVQAVDVGPAVAPGPTVWLARFAMDGGEVIEGTWRFPLDPGVVSPVGALVVTAGGPHPAARIAARPDPRAAQETWRIFVRGRAALAALAGGDDPALVRIARDVREQADLLNGAPDAAVGATALLFLVEGRRAGVFPVTDAEIAALAAEIPAPITADERAWVVRARAAAGLPVDGTLIELLRGDPLDSAVAAAHLAIGDPLPADAPYGIELAAALRAREDPRFAAEPLWMLGPPDPGDLRLPEWLAAVGDRLAVGGEDGVVVRTGDPPAAGYSWRAMPAPVGETAIAAQIVPGELGSVAPMDDEGCSPCRLALGDSLVGPALAAPIRATHVGTFTAVGRDEDGRPTAPLTYTVAAERGPLGDEMAVALAERAVELHETPALPAGPLPADLARRAVRVGFDHALLGGDDLAIAHAFRALAATDPRASVPLASVARAARALAASGDPVGSVRVWEAGLDAAFAREAAVLGNLEGAGGPLIGIQKVREAAARYPDGPLVAQSAYLLPARLHGLAEDGLPPEVESAGIRPADVALTAAAWDREFLATYPDHPLATAAGMRLARALLGLRASEQAAAWSARIRAAHPDAPLADGLVLLEALAATEAGASARASRLLNELVTKPWPTESGALDASAHAPDAWVAIGRIREAAGDVDGALAAYRAAGTDVGQQAIGALERTALSAPPLVRVGAGEAVVLRLEGTNVDEVRIRTYPIDLRTVFLRDLGLADVTSVDVAGVAPSWSGVRRLAAGSFPEARDVALPLSGARAWLVQVEGGGHTVSSLVVRSGLALAAVDGDGSRRVQVRVGSGPASGVEVRAIAGGEIVRGTTDVRGIVEVPAGAPVLAWSGEEVAFTDPAAPPEVDGWAAPPMENGLGTLLQGLDDRVRRQRAEDTATYDLRFGEASEDLALESL